MEAVGIDIRQPCIHFFGKIHGIAFSSVGGGQ